VTLARGETLLLFTDGVLDSGAGDRRLGHDGMRRLLEGLSTAPSTLVPALEWRLGEGGAPRRDDVAMLALGAA
jgi:serine phosphatase RsbU (regulator of sigma subunit)